MTDYSKGKIYKILNTIDGTMYVGSTVETLGQRMTKHRYSMKTKQHCVLYNHMHELGVTHFYIELIENFPCNDVYELKAREGHYIRQFGTLNMLIAGRTYKEWAETHKEQRQQYNKQHYEANKELYKKYHGDNKEHIKHIKQQYYEDNKQNLLNRGKQYREEHKELCSLYNKNYYENNSEELKTLRRNKYNDTKEKLTCDICGREVLNHNMLRHRKTKLCKSYVKTNDNEE